MENQKIEKLKNWKTKKLEKWITRKMENQKTGKLENYFLYFLWKIIILPKNGVWCSLYPLMPSNFMQNIKKNNEPILSNNILKS